ncbi:MAG TPA: cupin domain-containing protein, partial [Dongiaceae bacterium]
MMPREAEYIRLGQIELRFILDGAQTGQSMDMFEMTVQPGAKVPGAHYHVEVDEAAYGLGGVLTYTVEGETIELGVGDRLFVPRRAVHHFINLGTEPARILTVLTPAKIGPKYFREIAEVVNAGGPPDPALLKEVMRRHGLVAAQ